METKERIIQTGIENVNKPNILEDFYETSLDGLTPQLEISISQVLQMLSDSTTEKSQLSTSTYTVNGVKTLTGIRLDVEPINKEESNINLEMMEKLRSLNKTELNKYHALAQKQGDVEDAMLEIECEATIPEEYKEKYSKLQKESESYSKQLDKILWG